MNDFFNYVTVTKKEKKVKTISVGIALGFRRFIFCFLPSSMAPFKYIFRQENKETNSNLI